MESLPYFCWHFKPVIESQGGISALAKQIETHPQTLLEILNNNELPRVEILTVILNALGCQISIQPVASAKSGVEIAPTEPAPHLPPFFSGIRM